jgi:hypothetical protein
MSGNEEYKIGTKIKPTMDFEKQRLTLETVTDGLIKKMVVETVDFKEKCVRKALIGLGWDPPKSGGHQNYQEMKDFNYRYLGSSVDEIDATLFNGDAMHDENDREALRLYCERWLREIATYGGVEDSRKENGDV